MEEETKAPLKVTVFSDYVCPFCYVGDARLEKLKCHFDLEVDWSFFEIHPDNPAEGKPVSELGYSPEQWRRMMANLEAMAAADGLELAPRSFTTNSHRALLLAEAAKDLNDGTFEKLHKRLFSAYFAEQRNIGDEKVLREIAREVGMPDDSVERALTDESFERRLEQQQTRAAMLGIRGVPGFLFGKYFVSGAVPVETLMTAAEYATGKRTPEVHGQ
ncbi:MAG TPA: DsbA family oxidoreductase [Gammaproteobacteria bacterium]|nr:DsbA family oxidoreductase [Gammaproteobacteria bacterium]